MGRKLGFGAAFRLAGTLACALALLPPALAATVTVLGDGSAVTLATLNTGDTIDITVTLTTTDNGENAEKPAEPLTISSIENGQTFVIFTAGNYALSTSFPKFTAKMNNTVITASISGADNDETGMVNFVIDNNPVNSLSGELKGAYNSSAAALGGFGAALAAGAALTFTFAACPLVLLRWPQVLQPLVLWRQAWQYWAAIPPIRISWSSRRPTHPSWMCRVSANPLRL
jgi:hypothetical protein